jgi:hypothetical protein
LPDLDPRNNKQGWLDTPTSTTPAANLKIKDPWGANYLYRVGANAQNPDFDLWSRGKDGKTRTGSSASDLNHSEAKDDIRNF